ncbi:hypothetical protein THAOC_37301, partial [Thalassiosira oceanica]
GRPASRRRVTVLDAATGKPHLPPHAALLSTSPPECPPAAGPARRRRRGGPAEELQDASPLPGEVRVGRRAPEERHGPHPSGPDGHRRGVGEDVHRVRLAALSPGREAVDRHVDQGRRRRGLQRPAASRQGGEEEHESRQRFRGLERILLAYDVHEPSLLFSQAPGPPCPDAPDLLR